MPSGTIAAMNDERGTEAMPSAGAEARALYDGRLLPGTLVRTLLRSEALFPVATVARGRHARPLPPSDRPLRAVEIPARPRRCDLADYLALNRVAGLLVLKDGRIAREDYELGFAATARWASFSVAKSFTSTLLGAAIADGAIGSVAEPVTNYLPALAGSGYDGVAIRDVLRMASGVGWDETYTNPRSDRRRFLDLQIEARPGTLLAFMATLPRARPPGTLFNYNTGETFIVGALVEAATGEPLARYLSRKIWVPAGMESAAYWWLESAGGAGIGGSGIAATLRDYGRFGQFVLEDGRVGGLRIVPEGWFAESTRAQTLAGLTIDYGYQWWPLPDGDPVHHEAFQAQGIFGQRIYLNPRERLVVVVLAARPKPTDSQVIEDAAFFAAVARALA